MTPEPYSSKIAIEGFNAVAVYGLRHLKIINCMFTMNKHTALQAFDSTLYFEGNIIFSRNNGLHEGAMLLQGGSIFYLMPHTHIQARRGGGIYVEDEITVTTIPCFFQVFNLQLPCLAIDAVITLENTTADEAGSAVYGGNLDECFFFKPEATSQCLYILELTYSLAYCKLDNSLSPVSQVSSNPVAVHVCNLRSFLIVECILDSCLKFQ